MKLKISVLVEIRDDMSNPSREGKYDIDLDTKGKQDYEMFDDTFENCKQIIKESLWGDKN